MKLSIGNGDHTVTCGIEASKNIQLPSNAPVDMEASTILYAVCRFLRHSDSLRHRYVWLSYQLRLASGRGRRPQRQRFVAPAALMELPGAWAVVDVTVSPAAITIDRICLRDSYPAAQRY